MNDILNLRDLVYQETGMYFPDEKRYYFESRFLRRMEALGIPSFSEYIQYLKNGKCRIEEFHSLMNELTINETSFFRNKPQFSALEKVVLPEIIKAKSNNAVKSLKIWSAGCSSGEEVYSIAMVIDELCSDILAGWDIEVRGTDISKRVLEIAQKGIYSDYSVRNMPEEYRSKYIEAVGGSFKVKDCLKRFVQFSHLNLNDDMAMLFMKGYDVIFCKNVLIYFDLESKKRVIQHFFNSLVLGGHLFIGFSESLFGINDRFKLIHFPGGIVYCKVAHI